MLSADGRIAAPFLQLDGSQHRAHRSWATRSRASSSIPPARGCTSPRSAATGSARSTRSRGRSGHERPDSASPRCAWAPGRDGGVGRIAGRGMEVRCVADEACTVTAHAAACPARSGRSRRRAQAGRDVVSGEPPALRLKARPEGRGARCAAGAPRKAKLVVQGGRRTPATSGGIVARPRAQPALVPASSPPARGGSGRPRRGARARISRWSSCASSCARSSVVPA